MKRMILDSNRHENETDNTAIIDDLIQEIENHLQVISTKAHLRETSDRDVRSVFDAAENIEKLLEEVREYFLMPR